MLKPGINLVEDLPHTLELQDISWVWPGFSCMICRQDYRIVHVTSFMRVAMCAFSKLEQMTTCCPNDISRLLHSLPFLAKQ